MKLQVRSDQYCKNSRDQNIEKSPSLSALFGLGVFGLIIRLQSQSSGGPGVSGWLIKAQGWWSTLIRCL